MRRATAILALVIWTAPLQALVRVSQLTDELQLRAAYVTRFPEFVEWPADKPASTITICASERSPMLAAMRALVSGEPAPTRPITVRAVASPSDVASCHVLVMPDASPSVDAYARAAIAGHVLTVGDRRAGDQRGETITLYVAGSRLRFDIDLDHARQTGLRISSRLLRLAATVKGSGQ